MSDLIEFDALGTHWWLELFCDENIRAKLGKECIELVRDFEKKYSRFDQASLLSKLNSEKELKSPPKEMVEMLHYSLNMYDQTKGMFNISVGAVLEQKGYGKHKDDAARLSDDLRHDMVIDASKISLAPHIRLDFGGFGKGWLVDKLGRFLQGNGCPYFIINGGGDILVRSPDPIELALEHPYDHSLMIGTVFIQDGALASSSPHKRSWLRAGQSHHHLVNTLHAEQDMTATSGFVRAHDALTADVMSTVMMLADDKYKDLAAKKFGIEYLQIRDDLTAVQSRDFAANLY